MKHLEEYKKWVWEGVGTYIWWLHCFPTELEQFRSEKNNAQFNKRHVIKYLVIMKNKSLAPSHQIPHLLWQIMVFWMLCPEWYCDTEYLFNINFASCNVTASLLSCLYHCMKEEEIMNRSSSSTCVTNFGTMRKTHHFSLTSLSTIHSCFFATELLYIIVRCWLGRSCDYPVE